MGWNGSEFILEEQKYRQGLKKQAARDKPNLDCRVKGLYAEGCLALKGLRAARLAILFNRLASLITLIN